MTSPLLFQELLLKLENHWQGLPDKPDENPISTLCALWNHVTHTNPEPGDAIMQLHPLNLDTAEELIRLVEKRIAGIPLAYIIGRQTYMGLEFLASPDAMIPRKETELLGYAAMKLANQLVEERGTVQALDLCTGSGNVVLSLAHFIKEFRAVATDISDGAIGLAKKNAVNMELEKRVKFFSGDLFEPIKTLSVDHVFDLITCNPPYIATANTEKMAAEISAYEPRSAFDGGPFGVNFIMRLIREAPKYMKPDSWLVFEVGLGQGNSVRRMLEKSSSYQKIDGRSDKNGQIRVLMAQSY